MGTYWHKQGWLKGELDEVTGQPVPGAMPPGLYCEDEAAFRAMEKAAGVRRVEHSFTQRVGDDATWRPHLTVGGMTVRVATPAEVEILRVTAPSATAPDKVQRLAEAGAREHEATLSSFERLWAAKEHVPSRPPARPGPNRRARRAAAAHARRA